MTPRKRAPSLAKLEVLSVFVEDPATARYGSELMKATSLSSGSLYPILQRLEDDGWIEGVWEVLPADAQRPRRRYYRLTAMGLPSARAEIGRAVNLARRAEPKLVWLQMGWAG